MAIILMGEIKSQELIIVMKIKTTGASENSLIEMFFFFF